MGSGCLAVIGMGGLWTVVSGCPNVTLRGGLWGGLWDWGALLPPEWVLWGQITSV